MTPSAVWWDERGVTALPPVLPPPSLSVLDLPDSLLARVFSHLRAPRDVACAAAACASFRCALQPRCGREYACPCGAVAFTSSALVLPNPPGERWAFMNDGLGIAVDAASPSFFLRHSVGDTRVAEHVSLAAGPSHPGRGPAPLHRVRPLLCPACGLYLGGTASTEGCEAHESCAAAPPRTWAAVCGAYVTRCHVGGAPEEAGEEEEAEAEAVVGVGKATGAAPPPPPSLVLRCAGKAGALCGAPLAHRRAILSRDHTWALPGGPMEDAMYLNALIPSSFSLGPPRAEELAQGPFDVRDVTCASCRRDVGWMFDRFRKVGITGRGAWNATLARPPVPVLWHENVGRFGLCASAVVGDEQPGAGAA